MEKIYGHWWLIAAIFTCNQRQLLANITMHAPQELSNLGASEISLYFWSFSHSQIKKQNSCGKVSRFTKKKSKKTGFIVGACSNSCLVMKGKWRFWKATKQPRRWILLSWHGTFRHNWDSGLRVSHGRYIYFIQLLSKEKYACPHLITRETSLLSDEDDLTSVCLGSHKIKLQENSFCFVSKNLELKSITFIRHFVRSNKRGDRSNRLKPTPWIRLQWICGKRSGHPHGDSSLNRQSLNNSKNGKVRLKWNILLLDNLELLGDDRECEFKGMQPGWHSSLSK